MSRSDSAGASVLARLRDVRFAYREGRSARAVLDGVDLELRRGEMTVLLGRSGSGKSTLLNLVGGLDRPQSGSIEVDGIDLTQLDEDGRTLFRRSKVGFVFQFFNLVPTLTALENVLLPLELNQIDGGDALAQARELLAAVGLEKRADSFPERLSGGEQQRIAVARALVHDPALVLADEPTGNLDEDTATEVLHLLDRLTRGAGKTLLVVTHSQEVVEMANEAWRLEAGRLSPVEIP